MRFSIVTSFFRDSVSDAEALYSSICAQRADWEWAVTDDFSEDPSVRDWLLDLSARDARVRYVEQERKMQVLLAPGRAALGELVLQIDSDDLMLPGYLELLDSAFARFPEVGVAVCAGQVVDQHGSFLLYQRHSSEDMSIGGQVCYLGRCWRRELDPCLEEFLGEGFRTFCHDLFIVGHVSARAGLMVIPRPFVRYRQHIGDSGYEPFGARGGGSEMRQAHAESYTRFLEYYSPRKRAADGLFVRHEPVADLALLLLPAHHLLSGRVCMVGFSEPAWRRLLLEELYGEQEFSWSQEPEPGSLCVYHHLWKGAPAEGPAFCALPPGSAESVSWSERLVSYESIWQEGWFWMFRRA